VAVESVAVESEAVESVAVDAQSACVCDEALTLMLTNWSHEEMKLL
jgi:hypothetical protein